MLRRPDPAARCAGPPGSAARPDLPGTVSGFAARRARVYLPPAWSARPRPPVVLLLHGTPGDPGNWTEGGDAQATADAECVDRPLGNVETYLAVDVPAGVATNFATKPPGPGWAVAGLSEGATVPRHGRVVQVGSADAEPLAAIGQLVPLSRAAGITTCLVTMPGQGHTFDVWSAAFAQSLPFLAGRLGVAPAGACPPG